MTVPAQPPGTFDARPLVDPVDPAEVEAFARLRPASEKKTSTAVTIIVWVICAMAFLIVVPIGSLFVLGAGYAIGGSVGSAVAGMLGILLLGGAIIGGVLLSRRARRLRDTTRLRLTRFATANAMTYRDRLDDPPLPGMIFHTGSSRMATDALRGTVPRFVEFANYQYTTSNGKNTQTHRWGYVAVKLDVPLPNIVLDALGNNALGNTIASGFTRDQRLSLEGDFDRYFSLYCPAGYEADALYLFTPDIMARFVHHAAELDVEIVDDWLFLYTRRSVSTLDPATWAWLFGAVGALLVKLDQWARWRDERLQMAPGGAPVVGVNPGASPPTTPALPFAVPTQLLTPPGVAAPGRRLRRRGPWLVLILGVGIVAAGALIPLAMAMFAVFTSR
ncbi:hypothetical protein ACI3KS_13390 [Microbacterium sp. ZW T5_45]|uniref:hypothetical protein n=1 Tax=Microbacterium sp. ZW T5_45 TaxID=3378080 RepID=UPI00385194DA